MLPVISIIFLMIDQRKKKACIAGGFLSPKDYNWLEKI